MPEIHFQCGLCAQRLAIDAEAAGEEIRCPQCGTAQLVPALDTGPPAPPPAVEPPAAAPDRVFARRDPGIGEGFTYSAFISYRHVEPDRTWAKWLHTALETYRVPRNLVRERGFPNRLPRAFRDEEELPASADLSREIERALDGSRFLIVVCSPRTPSSVWVNAEVEHFRALGRHGLPRLRGGDRGAGGGRIGHPGGDRDRRGDALCVRQQCLPRMDGLGSALRQHGQPELDIDRARLRDVHQLAGPGHQHDLDLGVLPPRAAEPCAVVNASRMPRSRGSAFSGS